MPSDSQVVRLRSLLITATCTALGVLFGFMLAERRLEEKWSASAVRSRAVVERTPRLGPAPARSQEIGTGATPAPLPTSAPHANGMSDEEIQALAERNAAAFLKQKEPAYAEFFAQLGLDSETEQKIRGQLAAIAQARMLASARSSLHTRALESHNATMMKLLGEKYPEYVRMESSFPVQAELAKFQAHTGELGISISAGDLDAVAGLLLDVRAFSSKVLSNNLSVFTQPTSSFGSSTAVNIFTDRRDILKLRTTQLIEKARKAGLSDGAISALENYYAHAVGEYETQLTEARIGAVDPLVPVLLGNEKMLPALRQDPRLPPEIIRQMEATLEANQARIEAAKQKAATSQP